MTTYTFTEVARHAEKSGKCAVCGRPCKRAEKFWQTLNPFNKNADGQPKSRDEIWAELDEKVKVWRSQPVTHAKCKLAPTPTTDRRAMEAGS
jgi:hypothetical protein